MDIGNVREELSQLTKYGQEIRAVVMEIMRHTWAQGEEEVQGVPQATPPDESRGCRHGARSELVRNEEVISG